MLLCRVCRHDPEGRVTLRAPLVSVIVKLADYVADYLLDSILERN